MEDIQTIKQSLNQVLDTIGELRADTAKDNCNFIETTKWTERSSPFSLFQTEVRQEYDVYNQKIISKHYDKTINSFITIAIVGVIVLVTLAWVWYDDKKNKK